MGKSVIKQDINVATKQLNQNLNSGNLLANGRYSSLALVGNDKSESLSIDSGSIYI